MPLNVSSRPSRHMPSPDPRRGSICLLPQPTGLGGPASFTARLIAGLQKQGVATTLDPLAPGVRAVLVMGGTRRMDLIWRAKRRGVRIVQRLNGMNWVHRKYPTGARHYLKAEIANWILSTIRRFFADRIIYQSRFTQDWWRTAFGSVPAAGRVIYNGVDLRAFSPEGEGQPPPDKIRILMVEARLGSGMEPGLENAVRLLRQLNQTGAHAWELMVAGDVPPHIQARWSAQAGVGLKFTGIIPRDQVPVLDRSAHMLFSADLNAACPNSVIEALACGLPVIAFATGALPEMVIEGAGKVVAYGGNYWNLEPPVIEPLAQAAIEITASQTNVRRDARARAEKAFDIQQVVDAYLETLLSP
jgi:glycosyltransferase involved in cell wall biosynthesis